MSISAPFRAEISFSTFPLPAVSTSSLFSQQWVVVRLGGQHHELMNQLAGQSHSGGKAEISKPMDDREVVIQGKHEDHATHFHQRVTHDVHSTIQLLLIINHHVQPKNQ